MEGREDEGKNEEEGKGKDRIEYNMARPHRCLFFVLFVSVVLLANKRVNIAWNYMSDEWIFMSYT